MTGLCSGKVSWSNGTSNPDEKPRNNKCRYKNNRKYHVKTAIQLQNSGTRSIFKDALFFCLETLKKSTDD